MIIVLGVTMLFLIGTYRLSLLNEKEIVVVINDIQIPEEEFRLFLQDEKALTVDYFVNQYQAEYKEDFWHNQYGREIPLEVAKKNALDKLVKIKVEQQIAVELGFLKEATYKEILKEMKKEKSIYGADNLDAFQSYSVYHSKIILEAKEKYKNNMEKISEEELLSYYEKYKIEKFKREDDVEVLQIKIENLKEEEKIQLFEDITKDIEKGITIEELESKYTRDYDLSMRLVQYGEEQGKDELMSERDLILRDAACLLESNQMSSLLNYGEENYILVCLEKKKGKIEPFEEVKSIIEDDLKETAFERVIKDKIEQSEVQIDNEKLVEIQMN